MNTKKNERFAETDRRIRKAFTKMVLNKKTNQISVREICEATGINRSSFYLHYADIPALITAIVGEKWTESVERIHEEMHGDPNIFSEAYVAATLREAKPTGRFTGRILRNSARQNWKKAIRRCLKTSSSLFFGGSASRASTAWNIILNL